MKKNDDFDAVVIGAGLAGLTTAVELSRRGISTVVVRPKKDEACASRSAHGISTIKGILESDSDLFALKLEGHRGFESWLTGVERLAGVSRPGGVWLMGVEEVFSTHEYFKKEFGRIYRRDFIGAKRVKCEFSSEGGFVRAIYPGDWWVDPKYLLEVCEQALNNLSVSVWEGSVSALQESDRGAQVLLEDGEVVYGRNIFLCTGAGTSRLLKNSKIDQTEKFFAVPGYTFTGNSKISRKLAAVKQTSGVVQFAHKLYWGSTSEPAKLMLGSEAHETGRTLTHDGEEKLGFSHLQSLFSGNLTDSISELDARWGVRVRTRHRSPHVQIISQSAGHRVWINAGYYKSGIILSWLMAERLAETIVSAHPYFSSRSHV